MRFLFIFLILVCAMPLWSQESGEGLAQRLQFEINGHSLLESDDVAWGVGVKARYVIRKPWSVGPEVNYQVFEHFADESILGFGANTIYRLELSSPIDLFGGMSVGYGMPFLSGDNGSFSNEEGGIYYQPHGGIILNTRRNVSFSISYGYYRYDWKFSFEDFGNSAITEVTFKRHQISLGLIF